MLYPRKLLDATLYPGRESGGKLTQCDMFFIWMLITRFDVQQKVFHPRFDLSQLAHLFRLRSDIRANSVTIVECYEYPGLKRFVLFSSHLLLFIPGRIF